jgi:predicted RNase H-like nuclease (RuvC/YqgF family)
MQSLPPEVFTAIITAISSIATAVFGVIAARLKEQNVAQQTLLSASYKRIAELEEKLEKAWDRTVFAQDQAAKIREETAAYYQQRVSQLREELYQQLELMSKRVSEWQEKYYTLKNEYDELQQRHEELEAKVAKMQRTLEVLGISISDISQL